MPRQYKKNLERITSNLLKSASQPNNVVMFHSARSGSTVLGDLLNQHPKVHWDGEIYSPPGKIPSAKKFLRYLVRDPLQFLDSRVILSGKKIYGFETQFIHLQLMEIDLADFIGHLFNVGFEHFILLKRRNYLKLIVSAVIGHQLAKWHQSFGEQSERTQIKVNIEKVFEPNGLSLVATLEYIEERFQALENLLVDQKVLQLVYEDDISGNPITGYQRVCHFLEIEPYDVSVRYGKTNPFKLSDLIINFREVEQALQGTQFIWMLYE